MNRLQIVQNAAARLLTGTCKYEQITLILLFLHWYDVEYNLRLAPIALWAACRHETLLCYSLNPGLRFPDHS